MNMIPSPFKGIHYRRRFVYNLLTFLKLRASYNLRFAIAAQYIGPGSRVLDFCAGPGALKDFLPPGCTYAGVDASPEFRSLLSRKGAAAFAADLHRGIEPGAYAADVVVMLISLAQFRESSMERLLESFKQIAPKVVIVEDVTRKKRSRDSLVQKIMNYLCAREYFTPLELFTADEFRAAMQAHRYSCIRHTDRYWVGYHAS